MKFQEVTSLEGHQGEVWSCRFYHFFFMVNTTNIIS